MPFLVRIRHPVTHVACNHKRRVFPGEFNQTLYNVRLQKCHIQDQGVKEIGPQKSAIVFDELVVCTLWL